LTLARGEIVLTRFPFTDLSGSKVRPVLVLSPASVGRDVVLAAISSIMRTALSSTDVVISADHPKSLQRLSASILLSGCTSFSRWSTVSSCVASAAIGPALGRSRQAAGLCREPLTHVHRTGPQAFSNRSLRNGTPLLLASRVMLVSHGLANSHRFHSWPRLMIHPHRAPREWPGVASSSAQHRAGPA
jgi:hypothetical protein